jgi:HEAT repeat protein
LAEDDLRKLAADLNTPSWEIRCNAAEDLGDLGDPMGIPYLLKALADPVGAVRYAAAAALGKIGDPSTAKFLIDGLKASAFGPPAPILEALGNLRVKEAIPHLIAFLRDPDSRTRGVANNALMVTTGRSMGFKPNADEHSREEAIAKWEEWWQQNGKTFVVPGGKK